MLTATSPENQRHPVNVTMPSQRFGSPPGMERVSSKTRIQGVRVTKARRHRLPEHCPLDLR